MSGNKPSLCAKSGPAGATYSFEKEKGPDGRYREGGLQSNLLHMKRLSPWSIDAVGEELKGREDLVKESLRGEEIRNEEYSLRCEGNTYLNLAPLRREITRPTNAASRAILYWRSYLSAEFPVRIKAIHSTITGKG